MKNLLFSMLICGVLVSCNNTNTQSEDMQDESMDLAVDDVMVSINLTVSEGKRLIALGIARLPVVQEKMKSGMIIITKGSTNTYIAEELAKLDAPHGSFIVGYLAPVSKGDINSNIEKLQEIILVNGVPVDMSYKDALAKMKQGDIIFKGGNLLNYEKHQAAVCIGAPDGGTTYKLLPYVKARKASLIIPIGLEKQTYGDLKSYEHALSLNNKKMNSIPKLHLFKEGMIFTEIEALKQIADIKVFPMGAGGIAGREGGISLIITGNILEVEKALKAVSSIQGEKEFIN